MKLGVGIYKDEKSPGWRVICEREKIPFSFVEDDKQPIILFENNIPDYFLPFIKNGGIAILTSADPEGLPFSHNFWNKAMIENFDFPNLGLNNIRAPGLTNLFRGKGWGEIKVHENRITKDNIINDRFPVFLKKKIGKGYCFYSGMKLTYLLNIPGDTLRSFSQFIDLKERISSIDKYQISRVLVWILRKSFSIAKLPYVHLWYYPQKAPTVFNFRIDVDGTYNKNLLNISKSGKQLNFPLTFYINKSKCKNENKYLCEIDSIHEIGNHANVHNLFTDFKKNKKNIEECKIWLDKLEIKSGPWFAAPRGMWNKNLNLALEELGYLTSSDFGLKIDGFPFFPRINNKKSKVLQMPIHPYSVEKHSKSLINDGKRKADSLEVLNYFKKIILYKFNNNEPIFLYSHPEFFGEMAANILPEIKWLINELNIKIMRVEDFYNWWINRSKINLNLKYEKDKKNIIVDEDLFKNSDLYLKVLSSEIIKINSSFPNNKTLFELRNY
ncbi:MAG: polysaccharide deacetylase family protein [bacterium]